MTPEQRAEAVLQLIESNFGQSGRDVRLLAIRDEIVATFHQGKLEGLKEAGEIAKRINAKD